MEVGALVFGKVITKKQSIVIVFIAVLIIACLVSICGLNRSNPKSVRPTDNFTTDGLTLLERMYDDTDRDGNNESIELYTSAQVAPDGQMGWDTGNQWILLVRKDKEIFPLFDEWVQYGELQFWVVRFNRDQIVGPESTDLERHIYAMNTAADGGIELFDYFWDEQNLCYKKEIVLNPPNQWGVRHSNKYNILDPSRINLEAEPSEHNEVEDKTFLLNNGR